MTSDVRVERHHDTAEYARLVTPLLLKDEALYNLELAVVARVAAGETFGPLPPVLLTVHDGVYLAGTALMTRPYQVLIAPVPPDAAPAVADWFAGNGVEVPGAMGSPEGVAAFAARYAERTGTTATPVRAQGIFRLTTLVPPRPAPGALRQATEDDTDLVREWFAAFTTEIDLPAGDPEVVARRVREGFVWLWEDGRPVSLAGCGGLTPHGGRIGPVYTPPELRGRGYASAATAEVTRLLLARGLSYTFLYTDLANPTSNAIYRALGYEQVGGVQEVVFGR